MNVQFRGQRPASARPLAFSGNPKQPPVAAKSSAKPEKPPITGTFSLVCEWVKMSLRLIREGVAQQRQEKLAARKADKQPVK